MKIPFYGLDREIAANREQYMALIERTLLTGRVLQGPEIDSFEQNLAKKCGRKFAVTCGSSTDALAFALMAHDIGPGDEVIVTSFSFIASATPILRVGATPRFVDIEPNYYLADAETIETAINERTKGIIAVPLFGQTLDMHAMEQLASKYNLVLIEDAAQAFGAVDNGRPAGSLGKVSCISFDPTKVLASFGSAGGLLTDDSDIVERARQLRYHGRDSASRQFNSLGYNSQIASDRAAILDYKLTLMDEWQARRSAIADTYIAGLANVDEVSMPKLRPGSTHTWHKFVIEVKQRDHLVNSLKENGIACMVHYTRTLPDEPFIRDTIDQIPDTPIASAAAQNVLSLPIYPSLKDEEVQCVIDGVKAAFTQRASAVG